MGVDQAPTKRVIQLYSAECVALLKEAVEKEKLDLAAQPIQSMYHQPFGIGASTSDADGADDADTDTHGSINSNDKDNSSSSNEEEEEEQSSTVSEEDQEEQHDKVMPLNESSSSSTNTNTKTTAIKPIKTQKAKSQITATQKQRDALLRQLGTPPCRPFATSSKTILSIPSALLLPTSTTPPSQAAYELATNLGTQPVMVVLLRSGRLAAAVFSMNTCLAHRASTRYTIRKGQGKAQSTQDGNRRAKSIGSQLRRQGELALREDVVQLFADWTKAAYTTNAGLILVSLPKTMKKEFFQDCGLDREDPRLRTIPLDTGRPTFDTVVAVHEIMMRVTVGDKTTMVEDERIPITVLLDDQSITEALLPPSKQHKQKQQQPTLPPPKIEEPIVPLSPLHELARDGNLSQLIAMLQQHTPDDIGTRAGIDLMTPLHYAASNEHDDSTRAAACVTALLLDGHADPCMVDARHRVPYFLATHDKVRDAFRMARATLGEDYCDWEHGAKVGPALTNDDVVTKKIKAADKKKRQKARQKESKAKEQAAAQEAERQRQEQQELKNKEEDAKRIRAGLQPKSTAATNICDFCQTTCRGKRRNQMLQRLEYAYCSTDCVAKHKRELMAAAALARFGN
jgi:hypothetical protein